jgi:cobalamin biosynthetic protein CobC
MADSASGSELRATLSYHGGNLGAARRLFPDAPEPWIDLSTGINPWPYPVPALLAAAWQRLPQADEIARLEAAAAAVYGAGSAVSAVAAPGTQTLIQWLPRLSPARRIGLLGLTYGEHERAWRAVGAEITTVESIGALENFEVALVVNPNNPDGRLVAAADLLRLAERLAVSGGTLIVDEAFMDLVRPSQSLVPRLPPTAIVLRSFGKTFGLAGLRLGFAVAPPDIASALREALGPWPVSGAAVEIGRRALADAGWLSQTTARLETDAARLDACLIAAGFRLVGGTPLFRLMRHAAADRWFEHLAHAGILVRPFAARQDWLRFGIPGEEGAWQRLEAVLRGWSAASRA